MNWDFTCKAIYLGLMARRIIKAKQTGHLTDMDFLGNKRFELDGQLLSLIFEDKFKSLITSVRLLPKHVDELYLNMFYMFQINIVY